MAEPEESRLTDSEPAPEVGQTLDDLYAQLIAELTEQSELARRELQAQAEAATKQYIEAGQKFLADITELAKRHGHPIMPNLSPGDDDGGQQPADGGPGAN